MYAACQTLSITSFSCHSDHRGRQYFLPHLWMKELKHRCGILMALCWYMTQPDWDPLSLTLDFPDGSVEKKKNPPANAGYEGHMGSISGSGRCSKVGNGNLLHILPGKVPWTEEPSGLQSMGSQSWTRLSTCVHTSQPREAS